MVNRKKRTVEELYNVTVMIKKPEITPVLSGSCRMQGPVNEIDYGDQLNKCVLYVNIDIHYGDGVEEAFYTTNRVMTISFNKFGDYFPGTGDVRDIGYGTEKYYSLNVPLDDGIDDESYQLLFKPIMGKVMEVFRPGAVILKCGEDSLSGDRPGVLVGKAAGMEVVAVPSLLKHSHLYSSADESGANKGDVHLEELNILLYRSCPGYWEERLKSERVERIRQTKEHWESQCRLFMG